MKRGYNGDADNRHIDAEAKPREKCPFICAVVPAIGRVVWKQERSEQGTSEDWVRRSRSRYMSLAKFQKGEELASLRQQAAG